MPIYEYKCLDCGTQVEKMQRISDAPLSVCESCGGKMEKQISLSGFQFKGAGWYVTDYAAKKGGDGKSEKSASGGKSEKGEKSENTEKKSSTESTGGGESASNTKSDNAPSQAKESVSKKD